MKYLLSISTALLLAMSEAQPALAQDGANDLIKQAITAEGGADALRALKGLAIKGEARFWEPEQSEKAGGEPRFLGDATFTMAGVTRAANVSIAWSSASSALTLLSSRGAELGAAAAFATTGLAVWYAVSEAAMPNASTVAGKSTSHGGAARVAATTPMARKSAPFANMW